MNQSPLPGGIQVRLMTRGERLRRVIPVLAAMPLAFASCIAAFFLVLPMDQYFVFYPSIDTDYAPGYSHSRFAQVRPGMREEEVLALLGKPLDRWAAEGNTEVGEEGQRVPAGTVQGWSYSRSAGNQWADYAWLGRFVFFDGEGRVTGKAEVVFTN